MHIAEKGEQGTHAGTFERIPINSSQRYDINDVKTPWTISLWWSISCLRMLNIFHVNFKRYVVASIIFSILYFLAY